MRPRLTVIVPLLCLLIGVGLGGSLVGLWVQHTESDWVEAYGTWFGSISTVAALLWAVQTFRADQRQRQEQLDDAKAAEEAARLDIASKVSLTLRGGGGFGTAGGKQMDSVHVKIDNDSSTVVVVYQVHLDPRLKLKKATALPDSIRILPFTRWSSLVDIEPVAMPDEAFSDNPLPGFEGRMEYMAAGREWLRRGTDTPTRAAELRL